MAEFTVEQLVQQKPDAAGNPVVRVYFKLPPLYGIYQTSSGVAVQYADAVDKAQEQATSGAILNPLQRQIDALIDGWRTSKNPADQARARRYDERVAVALRLWLLGDTNSALAALELIKQDIADERTSFARFTYLQAAFLAAFALFVILTVLKSPLGGYIFSAETKSLWLAGRAACVGAFFSIAIGIKSRSVLPDLRLRDNVSDAVLRIVIGVIAGGVLLLMLQSGIVGDLQIGGHAVTADRYSWVLVLMLGFLAGFSERLVPDLLDTALSKTRPATTPAPPAPAAPALGVAPASAQPPSPPARPPAQPAAPTDAVRTRALEIWTRRGGQGDVTDYLAEAKRELGLAP